MRHTNIQGRLSTLAQDISRGLDAIAERRLRTALLEHTPVAIAILCDRVVIHANAAMDRLLGYPPGYFVGHSSRMIHADEKEFGRVGKAYATLRAEGRVTLHNVRARHRDGHELILELHGHELDKARSVWTLIDRTRQAQLQKLYQALMRVSARLLTADDEMTLLEESSNALIHDTVLHAVWITRGNAGHSLEAAARASSGFCLPQRLDLHKAASSLAAQAWRRQQMVYDNARDQDSGIREWLPFITDDHELSELAVPIRHQGRPWGVIDFISLARGVFDKDTAATCRRIAELLGYGLDQLELRERLQKSQRKEAHNARHDSLTGLPNRMALSEYLPRALARARRKGNRLAVGLMDLDAFKPINDTFGHEAGDALLQQLAQRIKSHLRETDFFCRLGGDEFVLVLENLESEHLSAMLEQVLERLRVLVARPFEIGQQRKVNVDFTLGLALYPEDGESLERLLRKADAAMYHGKQRKTGRRREWQRTRTPPPPDEQCRDERS